MPKHKAEKRIREQGKRRSDLPSYAKMEAERKGILWKILTSKLRLQASGQRGRWGTLPSLPIAINRETSRTCTTQVEAVKKYLKLIKSQFGNSLETTEGGKPVSTANFFVSGYEKTVPRLKRPVSICRIESAKLFGKVDKLKELNLQGPKKGVTIKK